MIGGPHLRAVGEHLTNAEIATRLFISIRTVESHVSSLLRKFGASDRRALSLLAAERPGDPAPPPGDTPRPVAPLPSPLTSFVSRASERAESLLDGHWDSAIAAGECFREGWERAGRPRRLLSIFGALEPLCRPLHGQNPRAFFDALVMLHRDQPGEALRLLAIPPNEMHGWYQGIWRPWYGALWVEAAVLADAPDAAERVLTVRPAIGDNPVAAALVDRAAALAAGDREGVLAAARALEAAGCRYQWARSLVLAGGAERARGASALRATLV